MPAAAACALYTDTVIQIYRLAGLQDAWDYFYKVPYLSLSIS